MSRVKTSYNKETHTGWGTEWTCRIEDFRTGNKFFGKGKTMEEATETAKKVYFSSASYKEYLSIIAKRQSGKIYLFGGIFICILAFYFWKTGAYFTSPIFDISLMLAGIFSFFRGIILLLKYNYI